MEAQDPRYEEARQYVQRLRGFYVHLAVYVGVNALLVTINLLSSPRTLWFYWPMLGWGIGLAAQALSLFGGSFLGSEWEERKIRQRLDRT